MDPIIGEEPRSDHDKKVNFDLEESLSLDDIELQPELTRNKSSYIIDQAETESTMIRSIESRRGSLIRTMSNIKFSTRADALIYRGQLLGVNDYIFLRTIGQGSFAEVKVATKSSMFRQNKDLYAVKMIAKKLCMDRKELSSMKKRGGSPPPERPSSSPPAKPTHRRSLSLTSSPPRDISSKPSWALHLPEEVLQEISILSSLKHPNLVNLIEVMDSDDSKYLYLVMDFVQLGPVMVYRQSTDSYICKLTDGVMLEGTASRMFRDIVDVLSYLHVNHIAHRDIKPDNILLDASGKIKITDFGVSNHFSLENLKAPKSLRVLPHSESRGRIKETEGTYSFYSPEMCTEGLESHSAYMADVWAASVCLWIFIFGKHPFQKPDIAALFHAIQHEEAVMSHPVSPELADLFRHILKKNPHDRLSLVEIERHCWVLGVPATNKQMVLSPEVAIVDEELKAKVPSQMMSKIKNWVSAAKSSIATRKVSRPSEDFTSVVEIAEQNVEEARRELAVHSLSDIMKLKKAAQRAKGAVKLRKNNQKRVVENLPNFKCWTQTAKKTVNARHDKIARQLDKHIRQMVEKSQKKMAKMKKGENGPDGSDSDFSFGGSSDSDICDSDESST